MYKRKCVAFDLGIGVIGPERISDNVYLLKAKGFKCLCDVKSGWYGGSKFETDIHVYIPKGYSGIISGNKEKTDVIIVERSLKGDKWHDLYVNVDAKMLHIFG
jgi:hypothetical protein